MRERLARDADAAAPPAPAVSVVVPTMGRPQLLQRCLFALRNQSLDPTHYEIIVANDRPDAATRAAVDELRALGGGPALRYVAVADGRGPAHARNRGWRDARGAIVAFTDDDTIADRDWLAEGLRAFGDGDIAAVSGRVIVPLPDAPTDYERDAAGLASAEFVTANCFVRRDALAAIGGFDERFRAAWREDSDLQFTLLERGLHVAAADRAVVLHPVRAAGFGVSLKQQRKVQFDALLYRKHPRLYRQRIRARPRWDYYAIVALLLLAIVAALAGRPSLAVAALALWLAITVRFAVLRLRDTSHRAPHVAEMLLTSAAIPPLAVFWRAVGSARFRAPLL